MSKYNFKRWYRNCKVEISHRPEIDNFSHHMPAAWVWHIKEIDGHACTFNEYYYTHTGEAQTRTAALFDARGYIDRVLGERAVEVQDQPPAQAKRRTPRSHAARAVKAVLAMTPAQRVEQRQTWRDQALRERLIAQGIIKTA